MNTKSFKRYLTLAIAGLFVMGCSNGSSKSESDQRPSTAAVVEQTQVSTVSDSQMAAVESDLASLDADLEVIDQAIADLDSVAP
jgi:PBP1b-binding outer membrane lipoprotein LpoB